MAELVAFLAVAAVVICTPGQDTALTIRNTLVGGRRAGIATALGVALGQAVWTVAAAVGVVAILSASQFAFTTLRLARARRFAEREGVRRTLEAFTGTVLAALGLRLAHEHR